MRRIAPSPLASSNATWDARLEPSGENSASDAATRRGKFGGRSSQAALLKLHPEALC